jgi:VIT1/CCC1 family predicted Fe2+/Mn2+ transporter
MTRLKVPERHLITRIGWLRAAVLGANDGILSTASLILGVTSAGGTRANILIAATAALVAGAMSMAAGEYVSVSSQHDTEPIFQASVKSLQKFTANVVSMSQPPTPFLAN